MATAMRAESADSLRGYEHRSQGRLVGVHGVLGGAVRTQSAPARGAAYVRWASGGMKGRDFPFCCRALR